METAKKLRLTGEQRRNQILETATELFAEKGYENTTTKEIAAVIGVSEMLIFKYFPSKDALYQTLFDIWAEEQTYIVRFEIIDSSAIATLRYIAENMQNDMFFIYRQAGRNTMLGKAVANRHGTQELRDKVVAEGSDLISESLLPIIIFGQHNGEICDKDPLALATMFSLIFVGGVLQSRQFSRFKQPPIDMFIEMIEKK